MTDLSPANSRERIEQFYDTDPLKEWQRLDRHRMELAVTLRALHEHLPPPPARILDIGGGPGRYSIALSQLGYEVTLLDLSQANLAFAQTQATEAGCALAHSVHGNALDLSQFADHHFDSVLLMGPLYHLIHEPDRQRCVAEAYRVLRPGGMLFASTITRYAAIRDLAGDQPEWAWESPMRVDDYLAGGVIMIPSGMGFTDHYAAHPHEVIPFMEASGLETQALIGLESLVALHDEAVNALTGDHFERWVDLSYRWGHDPALHGAALHLLYVGRRGGIPESP